MGYSSKEVIALLKENGFVLRGSRGSHHYYEKNGIKIPVPHPKKDLPKGTYKAILKQAGLL